MTGTSLVVRWLRLCVSTAGGTGSVPGQGTKIPHAAQVVHHQRSVLHYSVLWLAAAAAKSLQSCPTLCDPRDGSPPSPLVPGIIQAGTLEWVAISFPNAWKWKVKVKSLSRVRLCVTPWTAAYQAPPPMGFSRQEYWSGVPLPSPIWFANHKL